MKTIITILFLIFLSTNGFSQAETIKVEAQPGQGFAYSYYLYVPPALRQESAKNKTHSLLVIPNNTGILDDDLNIHEQNVKQKMLQVGLAFGKLNIPVLMPVFPRPKTDWKIYTHALDRDSMLTEKKEYQRFDLQLAAMIKNARQKLAQDNLKINEKVLLYGFSAAGMFVNRFAFLHPEQVRAVAVGSPGGWPLAPSEKFKGQVLGYPIGTGDFKTVAGKKLDLKSLKTVQFYIFMGDKDDNDSLVFRDGYEDADQNLVFELFGKTPLERWEMSRKLYQEANLQSEFKLYPNTAHKVTPEMITDVLAFFTRQMAQ
jgi:predicted esterase